MARVSRPPAELGMTSAGRLEALVEAGVALSGTLRLEAVLRRIVKIACRVLGARYGALGVLNEEGTGLESFVFHGMTKEEAARMPHLPKGLGVLGVVIDEARPLRLDEIRTHSRSVGFPPGHPEMRTFLGVPVMARGRVFGRLYLTEKRGGRPFTEEDEQVAMALARQAGVAVENARLYEEAEEREREARRRVREVTSLQEVGRALLGELDPLRVLRLIAERAREITGAQGSAIAMKVPAGDEIEFNVVVGRDAAPLKGLRRPIGGSVSGDVVASGRPVLLADIDGDREGHYPVVRILGARSAMFAPLIDRGVGVGLLAVAHRSPGRFDEHDLSLLQSFADLASQAMRNARLFAEERERAKAEADLAAATVREHMKADLLRQVIRAQEEERRRISRDLHDSAGQAFASILLGLKVAEQERTPVEVRSRIADLRELTSDAVAEMRRLALELRPTVLDDLGLAAAVERYARDFESRTGVQTHVELGRERERLAPELETVLYRVVQEALTNVAKYARATSARVEMRITGRTVRLRVSDDGVGFVPEEAEGKGLGLAGMRERVGLVNGKLRVRSAPGEGTTLELEVPR